MNEYNPRYDYSSSPKKPPKKDLPIIGFLAGLIFPILGLIILYFLWSKEHSFGNYIKIFTSFNNPILMNDASKAFSLSIIANLIPFYYFLNRKRYYTARGVIIATLLFVLLIVLYKFVWQ